MYYAESLIGLPLKPHGNYALERGIQSWHVFRMLPIAVITVWFHAFAASWWEMSEKHTMTACRFAFQSPCSAFGSEILGNELLIELLEGGLQPSACLTYSNEKAACC